MADPELVRVLDYILNRSDEASIEAVAAAVVRRKRDLSLFGSAGLPEPRSWARQTAVQLNQDAALDGIRKTVESMAVEMLHREAPELGEEEVAELLADWIPNSSAKKNSHNEGLVAPDTLVVMIKQFISHSLGRMETALEASLRDELGAWPQRYWTIFPPGIRALITEFLQGEVGEKEFYTKLRTALDCSNI